MIKYTCEGIENLRDLYFVQHMTIEQISKIVGTSKQNVSKLIHKYFTTEEIQAEKTFRILQSNQVLITMILRNIEILFKKCMNLDFLFSKSQILLVENTIQ